MAARRLGRSEIPRSQWSPLEIIAVGYDSFFWLGLALDRIERPQGMKIRRDGSAEVTTARKLSQAYHEGNVLLLR